jgi:hypothetical protein
MNEAIPLDTSGAQRGSESFLTQPKPSLDTGTKGLQPSAPEALMEEKAAERQPSADAEIPPSVASTVNQTETMPEQRPASETDRATVPQETNGKRELQASHGAKPSAGAFAPGTPTQSDDSALVSADSPPAPSQHAIVPDLSAAAPIPDPQGPQAAGQSAETVAANTPDLLAPMRKAPDLPAEAATPELQAAEQPAEAVAVNTPEQHLDASPPDDTALPPVTTAPPSVDVTALPHDADIIPKPLKPVIQKPVAEPAIQKPTIAPPSVDVTALPNDTENVRKPFRKPVIQSPGGKSVSQKPVAKPVIQKPVGEPVIQKPVAKHRAEVDSKPAGRPRAKGQSFFDEKVRSSIADLLAGGL